MTVWTRTDIGPEQPPAAPGFGDRLRYWRTERGYSQMRMAEFADCEPAAISRWESGSRNPRRQTVIALADALTLTGYARVRFFSSAGYIEHELTDEQAEILATWNTVQSIAD